jgi:hypothetical protein
MGTRRCEEWVREFVYLSCLAEAVRIFLRFVEDNCLLAERPMKEEQTS